MIYRDVDLQDLSRWKPGDIVRELTHHNTIAVLRFTGSGTDPTTGKLFAIWEDLTPLENALRQLYSPKIEVDDRTQT